MNPMQQNWINFNTHFSQPTASELTMEAVGYHQYIQVDDIVAHMSGLPFHCPSQKPEYTPTPNPGPTIVPTIQPTPVSNVATNVFNILPQILTIIQQMQQLIIWMHNPFFTAHREQTHNGSFRMPSSEPGQRHRHTHVWTTIPLPIPGARIHPNTN